MPSTLKYVLTNVAGRPLDIGEAGNTSFLNPGKSVTVSTLTSKAQTEISNGNLLKQTSGNSNSLGFASLALGASAVGLPNIPAGATSAVIVAETNAARWRDDGTAPTAAVGMNLAVGQVLTYDRPLAALKLISQSATCNLTITYYAD